MGFDLGALNSGQELRAASVVRAKKVDEKTVSAASPKSLKMKVDAEIEDGWTEAKKNKRSVRMERSKPTDRQLEDDVWTLFYKMGFTELNADRRFLITMKDGSNRQIDVFAKDDETVFVVECTHSRDGGAKSVKGVLDKIEAIREDVIKAIHEVFGKEPKLKVKFAVAVRNVEIRGADRERAQQLKVPIITDTDIEYFSKLAAILKSASRFQFLGRYLQGEKVEGLRTRVPATRGRVGETTFYNFLISPHELLRIAYISHKGRSENDDLESYQRMVKTNRLKAIGAYIDNGGTFPTNIVVNIKLEGLNFDIGEGFGNTTTGTLNLPGQYGSAWVIDGQHRLYGFAYAGRAPENDQSVVSVLAYENLPVRKEIEMFVDINTKQVKVQRNLVNEIISSLDIDDVDPRKRLDAMCARIVLALGREKSSPVYERVLTVGETKNNFQCLTLTSFADGIDENNLLGRVHKANGKKNSATLVAGPLGTLTLESADIMQKARLAIAGYLDIFAKGVPEHWALGDAKGGYLCTNLGLRSLLVVFRKLIVFCERDGVRADGLNADEVVDMVRPYAAYIVEYFKKASPDHIARFRNRGSSLKSVSENAFQMMAIIAEADQSYDDKEVKDYLAKQDIEGTRLARTMIDEINEIIFDDVVKTLKEKFGPSGEVWWLSGVPRTVRNEADRRFNDEDGAHDRWQYLMFIDYISIVQHGDNWDLFKDRYNFYGKGAKATLIRWIKKINDCRKITHHAEKGPLSHEQVDYVRSVHELVKTHIRDAVPVDGKNQLLFDDKVLRSVPEAA